MQNFIDILNSWTGLSLSDLASVRDTPGSLCVERRSVYVCLNSGEVVTVFTGTKDDAMRFVGYLFTCKKWLADSTAYNCVPTFRRTLGQAELVSCPGTFTGRLQFAADRIRQQDTNHSAFGACFAMPDSEKLIRALMLQAKKDAFLEAGIKALGCSTVQHWTRVLDSYADLPLLAVGM